MVALVLTLMPFAFAFLVIFGALSDLSSFRIPNWVTYGLVLLYGVFAFFSWLDTPYMPSLSSFHVPPFLINVGLALLVLIVSIIFWRRGYIGGGDAKYLAATALWMGPYGVALFMACVTGLALVMALLLKASAQWGFLVHATGLPAFVKRLYAKIEDNQLPYGFPIGIAALIMIPVVFKF